MIHDLAAWISLAVALSVLIWQIIAYVLMVKRTELRDVSNQVSQLRIEHDECERERKRYYLENIALLQKLYSASAT